MALSGRRTSERRRAAAREKAAAREAEEAARGEMEAQFRGQVVQPLPPQHEQQQLLQLRQQQGMLGQSVEEMQLWQRQDLQVQQQVQQQGPVAMEVEADSTTTTTTSVAPRKVAKAGTGARAKSRKNASHAKQAGPSKARKGSSGAASRRRGAGGTAADEVRGGMLSVHNAFWFLELLENSNMDELTAQERAKLVDSGLRVKPKHRTAILFQDDADFVLHGRHDLVLDHSAVPQPKSGNKVDDRVQIIRQACKDVIEAYETSIQNAPLRSCIWSALMHRAEFHLRESGFADVSILESEDPKKESMLCLQGHQISRSNFTKIARQFCEQWSQVSTSRTAAVGTAPASSTSSASASSSASSGARGVSSASTTPSSDDRTMSPLI